MSRERITEWLVVVTLLLIFLIGAFGLLGDLIIKWLKTVL